MMQVTLWGTRGSLAAPGPETAYYGGNTSCVEVRGSQGTILVLDAGTGIRRLGAALPPDLLFANGKRRVDILLTHLHMDHIQGLGFFAPLFDPTMEVHIWGPAHTTQVLRRRLTRYLSPPLFPIHLRDLPCQLTLHEMPCAPVEIGEFQVSSALVCHPGPTVGYRIVPTAGDGLGTVPNSTRHPSLAYIPDHEPALGLQEFGFAGGKPLNGQWASGFDLAAGVDLLIHDAQFSTAEYATRVGWGHSSVADALGFAALVQAGQLVLFHHDPGHSDADLDQLIAGTLDDVRPRFAVTPGVEGAVFTIGA